MKTTKLIRILIEDQEAELEAEVEVQLKVEAETVDQGPEVTKFDEKSALS